LTYCLGCTVVKVNFKVGLEVKEVKDVVYFHDMQEKVAQLKPLGRVIFGAGAQGSTHVSHFSGIGNCSHLLEFGIECHVDIPEFGQFTDHQDARVFVNIPQVTFANGTVAPVPATLNTGSIRLYVKCPYTAPDCVNDIHNCSSTSADSKMHDMIFTGKFVGNNFISIPLLVKQENKGLIQVQYVNPLLPPSMVQGYAPTGNDARCLAWGFNESRRIVELAFPAWRHVASPNSLQAVPYSSNIDSLAATLYQFTNNQFHSSGIARMGREGDPAAITCEKSGRLFGTENVYYVDASVLPQVPRNAPNAAIRTISTMFAENQWIDME